MLKGSRSFLASNLKSSLRDSLPKRWQYGYRWTLVRTTVLGGLLSWAGIMCWILFMPEASKDAMAADLVFIHDERGRPMDIAYRREAEAALDATRRAKRLSRGDLYS